MAYRTRQMFIGQRTQTINALRSHLSEHGVIAPKSKAGVRKLVSMIEDDTVIISEKVREIARVYVDHIEKLTAQISDANEAMKGFFADCVGWQVQCRVATTRDVVS